MNQTEHYEFDREGFLVIKGMLTPAETASLRAAIDSLQDHALRHLDLPPRKQSPWGSSYHRDEEKGYHTAGSDQPGQALIIEDFLNADPAFDFLVNHARTMDYVREIVQGKIRINNSEIRIRYTGNASGTHMGGPIDHKYRYGFNAQGIDCMMVRMIYFPHDVTDEEGAFCVVPGTHKSSYVSPYRCAPDDEPGMIGLPVQAGDAILFTENLRHGGFTNRSGKTRKTLHVGYGPAWMMSQNMATMDEPQYVLPQTLARYDDAQRQLLEPPVGR